jgi:hypothetical protein
LKGALDIFTASFNFVRHFGSRMTSDPKPHSVQDALHISLRLCASALKSGL